MTAFPFGSQPSATEDGASRIVVPPYGRITPPATRNATGTSHSADH